ncbi:MAG: PD-(D/E)XK nuclease family protein [Chloroflexi bacterium]|nr:PD-(D/E)XK nuclease family protein [Chloroflexota bacterium]
MRAALEVDQELSRAFVSYMAGPAIDGIDLAGADIVARTQQAFDRPSPTESGEPQVVEHSSIDLVLTVNDSITVAVEHKLLAHENPGQLVKYLRTNQRVAFVTRNEERVSDEAWKHPLYLKPRSGRRHFVWQEMYPLVRASALRGHPLCGGLLDLYAHLGLQPPDDEFGDPLDRDEDRRQVARENWARAWTMYVTPDLASRNWQTSAGSVSQIYAKRSGHPVYMLLADPNGERGMLRVRLYVRPAELRARLVASLTDADLPGDVEVLARWTAPATPLERGAHVPARQRALGSGAHWGPILSA